jgi:hypothetical protein
VTVTVFDLSRNSTLTGCQKRGLGASWHRKMVLHIHDYGFNNLLKKAFVVLGMPANWRSNPY